MPGEFTLRDKAGQAFPLRRLEPGEAEKTLGVYIAMDGNHRRQLEYLRNIAITFGLQVRSVSCPKSHVLYTFAASFMKSLEHSLPVTGLSKAEWRTILTPALAPTLQRAGICKNAPRTPLFMPSVYGGFGWKHPFHLQGLSHVQTLLQESVSNSQTGELLRHTSEALRLELGTSADLTESDLARFFCYLTPPGS